VVAISVGLGCVIIIGVLVYFIIKAYRTRGESTEHVYETVIYDTKNHVARDSAKYVTMTPGESPSVAHYLLYTRQIETKPRQMQCQQGHVANEGQGYVSMKPGNSAIPPKVFGVETPEYIYDECRY
ncbi:hypothetical protein ABMA27_011292, partial [Loxostege sticticalis]